MKSLNELAVHQSSPDMPENVTSEPAKYFKRPLAFYWLNILSAMGGFLVGYNSSNISAALIFIKVSFHLETVWQEMVVSSTIVGAFFASIALSPIPEAFGRKKAVSLSSILFVLGSLLLGLATDKYTLLAGRLVVGMAVGITSSVAPVYMAESASSNIRGTLVSLYICFQSFGALTGAVVSGLLSNSENGWRWMLGLSALPASIQFLGFIFMPESPRWLVKQERNQEAILALERIQGLQNPEVKLDFDRIQKSHLKDIELESQRRDQKRSMITVIFTDASTRRALFIGCFVYFIQQVSGINTIMYYAATIFEMSGVQSQSMAVWLSVPSIALKAISSCCACFLSDWSGRRTMLLGSLIGVSIGLILIGSAFQLSTVNDQLSDDPMGLDICGSKRTCSNCVAREGCGFCYTPQNLTRGFCLAESALNKNYSAHGQCSQDKGNFSFVFINSNCPQMVTKVGIHTWMVLSGLFLFWMTFALGLGPIPLAINSEIYPMWARDRCISISNGVHYLSNLVVAMTFQTLIETFSSYQVFYSYAALVSFGGLVLFWKLPETRGVALEDIKTLFADKRSQK